ncbi:putative GMP synthase (glutamine-hydrolyzing) [uncultured Alphaproteobacteria bacterium]|uniref:Putative GMP synthase (Glutamine-hydrolyzing) n=1 Tax=uncultured Alphaproteobacteria bacterium TaxID=91750 RepID=A0A212K6D1_9PROT|nr:putative GMP synthase (glutamine-hydrolyzing) [uncultured Alphaproteobacteria bacterium]
MHLLVIVNAPDAPAGRLAERIAARGWRADEVLPHAPGVAPLPASDAGYDALAVLGGAQDAWDDSGFPRFADELRLMRRFDAAGKPVLGICLGAQLMARAWGAEVRRMETGAFERGLVPMRRVAAEPLLDAAGDAPLLTAWHRDTFDLPDGATLFLSSAMCAHQGFRIGNASWGFQCHIEATPEILGRWLEKSPQIPTAERDRVVADCGPRFAVAARAGAAIIDAWLDRVSRRAPRTGD